MKLKRLAVMLLAFTTGGVFLGHPGARRAGFQLEPERLLIVEAGYDQIGVTRLAAHSIGGVASTIYVHVQKDPEHTPASRRQIRPKPRP